MFRVQIQRTITQFVKFKWSWLAWGIYSFITSQNSHLKCKNVCDCAEFFWSMFYGASKPSKVVLLFEKLFFKNNRIWMIYKHVLEFVVDLRWKILFDLLLEDRASCRVVLQVCYKFERCRKHLNSGLLSDKLLLITLYKLFFYVSHF